MKIRHILFALLLAFVATSCHSVYHEEDTPPGDPLVMPMEPGPGNPLSR